MDKNIEKIKNLLRLAYKARGLKIGASEVAKACSDNKNTFVIFSTDISENSKDFILKIINYKYKNVKQNFLNKNDLGLIFNRKEVAVIAVKNANFAKGLKDLFNKK